ncbi:MAG TPA: type II secretion system F family protein [Bacillota bacterium]
MLDLVRAAASLVGALAVGAAVAARRRHRGGGLPAASRPPLRQLARLWLGSLAAGGARWARRARGGGRADPAGLELALLALASELEAGAELLEALRRVLAHLPEPTAAGLRMGLEEGAPRDGVEVVRRWADRTGDPVLEDLASTLALHRGTGGPLGPVLRRLAGISRRRRLLAAQLQARTAEARLSAVILAATPVALALFVAAWRPEMLTPLWTDATGRAALLYGVVSWSLGVAWIRAMLAGAGRGAG